MNNTPSQCPCGSGRLFDACCGPFLEGKASPPTAEALMRSRYSAYVLGSIAYLQETLDPKKTSQFDEAMVRELSESAVWQGLEILDVVQGGKGDTFGEVEFVARFTLGGIAKELKERSTFKRIGEKWFYSAGKVRLGEPAIRQTPKVGRNAPCPCGSGKKSKKCCGR